MTGVLVLLAGGLGAGTRVAVDSRLRRWSVRSDVLLGSLVVNVVGSLLLGVFLTRALVEPDHAVAWYDVLGTGFCGGLTTFSAVTLELAVLVGRRDWPRALLVGPGTLALSVAAVWAGLQLGA